MVPWRPSVCLLIFGTLLTVLQAQNVRVDSQCGTSKGCFSDCDNSGDCGFLVTWEESGIDVIYTLATSIVATGDSYVVLGLSNDDGMGEDSVFGCRLRTSTVTAYSGYNPSGYTANDPFTDTDVALTASSTTNGVLSCTITRPIAANGNRFAADQEYYYFLARGQTSTNGILYHGVNKFISPAKTSSTSRNHMSLNGQDSSPPQSSGAVPRSVGCGDTLGCFSDSSGTFEISWRTVGMRGEYTIKSVGSANYYFAIGFSSDSEMGSDIVIGAGRTDTDAVAYNARNNGKSSSVEAGLRGTELVSSSVDGEVYTFTILQDFNSPNWVDIEQQWTLLFARGRASFANDGTVSSVRQHSSPGDRFLSGQAVSVNDKVDVSSKAVDQDLVKTHGALMIAAWAFFASVGVITARYYKPAWKDTMCSQAVWFQIHRTCMILAFLTTAAGFIVIFVEVEEWSDINQEDDEYLEYHPILGVIVMGLTLLNPIMAFFRPHPGTPKRPFFNWGHWFVGTAAHILGVINIFFGLELFEFEEDYLVYILAGFVGWHVFMEVLLISITYFWRDSSKTEFFEMGPGNYQERKVSISSKESPQAATVKKVLLVLHFLVVTSITAILIALLADADEE